MKPIFILFISAILLLSSCQDDCPNVTCTDSNTVNAPSAIKDYFVFKAGSYWIYQNPLTFATDCLYVKGLGRLVQQPAEEEVCVSKCYEQINQTVFSVKFGRTHMNVFPLARESKDSNQEIFCVDETDYSVSIPYPFTRFYSVGNTYHTQLSSEAEWTYIDSALIKGKTYYKIQKFQYGSSIDKNDYLRSASYAKNIGLVSFKRKDNSEWELIEYFISP